MIAFPSSVRVWLAVGRTDMRRGMNSLALQVQQSLGRDPHGGDLYVFRGAKGDLVKILWHDGIGMSLYAKRLERDGLRGRRQRTALGAFPPRSSLTCSTESIGGTRVQHSGLPAQGRRRTAAFSWSTWPRIVIHFRRGDRSRFAAGRC
jgi:hypothetical protein